MKKGILWGFALACLVLAGGRPASASDAPLFAEVTAAKTALTTEDGVNVRFTLTNQGASDLFVLQWKTPLAGFEGDLFAVERDGEPVPYTGRLVKRAAPRPSDYVRIEAGGSVSAAFDLSAVYDMRQPGTYTVRYRAVGLEVVREDFRARQTVSEALDLLESDALALTLSGRDLRGDRPEGEAAPEAADGKALTPTYLNCSNGQISSIGSALANAQNYATESYNFLVGLPAASRPGDPRYTTWFGAYDSTRYSTVQSHYQSLKDAFSGQTFQLDCDCASDNTLYAYVFANQPYHVHLCGAFFSAPATGTDSKAGTLVHETSHFTVVAGTNDYAYGQTACKKLASKTPKKAIANADSHEYFAENNPFQSIHGGGATDKAANCAQYVREDPPYDYSYVPKNAWLTKTWYIKNCGTATWTTSWGVQKLWGNACGSFNFTKSTAPGATAKVWATCFLGTAAQYEVHFKVKTSGGTTFGDEFWFVLNTR